MKDGKFMQNFIKSGLEKLYRDAIATLVRVLIPKAYKDELYFFEKIRAMTYTDRAFREAELRSIAHQIDKTLTFNKFKNMGNTVAACDVSCKDLMAESDYDKSTMEWCLNVLSEYRNISEGQPQSTENYIHYDANALKLLNEIIESRRSIRSYKTDAIDKETMEKILQSGLWAPTGCNRQTIEYLILDNKDDIRYCKQIAGEGYAFPVEAPIAIIVFVDPRNYSLPVQRHMAYLEAGAAIQNILLTSHCLGIGSCWLFWSGRKVSHNEFIKKFNLNSWLLPVSMVCFGYPDIEPKFRPERKSINTAIHHFP